jgi:hypothetical protein
MDDPWAHSMAKAETQLKGIFSRSYSKYGAYDPLGPKY